jgi:deoxycytidylate deaminase
MATGTSRRPKNGPELFIGLAGAVGTDLEAVATALRRSLKDVGYQSKEIHLSSLLDWIDWSKRPDPPRIDDSTYDQHVESRMEAGDCFREELERGDAVALLGILEVTRTRPGPKRPVPRTAYIFRSLKHPQEVATLREVYGSSFFLISAYAPVFARAEDLQATVQHDWERKGPPDDAASAASKAWALIDRDRHEEGRSFGQRLGETFPRADVFVDAREQQRLQKEIERFIELLFDHPFHTPTRAENAMFHAQAAALRSAAPGRQVGAVITTSEGDIVAVGTNEVPKPGGGQYWADDDVDDRDHNRRDRDVSGNEKRTVIEQILRRLNESGWLAAERQDSDYSAFYALLDGLRVRSLIEFERAVHAEMAAIVDAARRGVTVAGGYLYTTTFPCHECTRHIIAAGIRRVFYIEPYPKSLAARLHDDAILIDPDVPDHRVAFMPFVGIAPRRYLELFTPSPEVRKVDEKVTEPRPGWFPKCVPGVEP